jgi:hypothetical protein
MENPDYGMEHRPAGPDFGAPLHDVTNGIYPADFYDHTGPSWYGDNGGDAMDHQSHAIISSAKGRPHKLITIYRAVPKYAPRGGINPGDWVSINSAYARQHGASFPGGFKLRSKVVKAGHVFTEGNSLHEQGYHPVELPPKPPITPEQRAKAEAQVIRVRAQRAAFKDGSGK